MYEKNHRFKQGGLHWFLHAWIHTHLKYGCSILEVGEGLHNVLIEYLDGFLPISSKSSHQLLYTSFIHLDPVPLAPLQEGLYIFYKTNDPTKVRRQNLISNEQCSYCPLCYAHMYTYTHTQNNIIYSTLTTKYLYTQVSLTPQPAIPQALSNMNARGRVISIDMYSTSSINSWVLAWSKLLKLSDSLDSSEVRSWNNQSHQRKSMGDWWLPDNAALAL